MARAAAAATAWNVLYRVKICRYTRAMSHKLVRVRILAHAAAAIAWGAFCRVDSSHHRRDISRNEQKCRDGEISHPIGCFFSDVFRRSVIPFFVVYRKCPEIGVCCFFTGLDPPR